MNKSWRQPLIKYLWPYVLLFIILFYFLGIILSSAILFSSILIAIVSHKLFSYGRFHRVIVNITITLTAVFLTAVLIELWLHLARPTFLGIRPQTSQTGDFADFTSRGYLNDGIFSKDKTAFRILGLGDSFAVYLRWKSQNYHNYLQDHFDRTYGPNKIEVVNAGMEATGPGYYWHILNTYGDSFKPDLVLVGFFVGNDFLEMEFDKIQLGGLIWERRDPLERFLNHFYFGYSWVYKFVYRETILIEEARLKADELKRGVITGKEGCSKDKFLRMERDRMWICDRNKRNDFLRLWDTTSHVILDFKEWGRKRNVDVVFLIFPDEFQINSDLFHEILKEYGIPPESIDLNFPNSFLADFCRRHAIHCVNMVEQFQKTGESRQLYVPRDTHWNQEGNRLAARLIIDYLEKNNLVHPR